MLAGPYLNNIEFCRLYFLIHEKRASGETSVEDSKFLVDSKPLHSGEMDLVLIYPPWPVLDDRSILQNFTPVGYSIYSFVYRECWIQSRCN